MTELWPNGARLAVTISMQFEAGGQPISGAPGPVTEPIQPGYPDLPQNTFFDYGVREGSPRMLDLFDKHAVKVSSFMIGEAVDRHPELAAEIVRRGHEAAAHGRRWASQYLLDPDEERAWIADSVTSIERATGTRPRGYNAYWIRGSEQLYEEGATRRRMMSISLHDRISGHASRVRVLDRFLSWAREKPDIWWARRDEIADWALSTPDVTPVVTRPPADVGGLPSTSGEAPG